MLRAARDLPDVTEAVGPHLGIDEVAASIAHVWTQLLTAGIEHVRARLELALEAARQSELAHVMHGRDLRGQPAIPDLAAGPPQCPPGGGDR